MPEIGEKKAKLELLSEQELKLYKLRHSIAHVAATAVIRLFPGVKLGFGPPVENGFYYDFEFPKEITVEDLPRIEKEMRKIIGQKVDFVREDMTVENAREMMVKDNQTFKVDLIDELTGKGLKEVSIYKCAEFTDICEGPHVANTKELPADAFKLDSIAGAYWRGNEKNQMLTRIYGLAFANKNDLAEYLKLREEAARRDHRKLGQELDIFTITDEVGKGLPLWLPNGTVLREELEKLAKEYEFKYGYSRVATPELGKNTLYLTSGHLPYYEASMFPPMVIKDDEGREEVFYMKPMNCPHHHMIYKARPRSYRDLPLRLAEYGHVYRYEKSGELAGLLRVRGMCMNDAHLYVQEENLKKEFQRVMQLHLDYYNLLGLTSYYMRLSLHNEEGLGKKYHNDAALWLKAEQACKEAMDEIELPYVVAEGEAAFYGPKVDVQIKNVVGREETASTNQVDHVSPERFDLTYIGKDGREHRPVVLHRAPLGTHERFIAFLIEHYAGAFPTWLAPEQVRIVPVNTEPDLLEYANKIKNLLFENFVRVELDDSNETFNKKIRLGAIRKTPILLIMGHNEAAEGKVTVRRYKVKAQQRIGVDEFLAMLLDEIKTRKHVKPDEE